MIVVLTLVKDLLEVPRVSPGDKLGTECSTSMLHAIQRITQRLG